MSILPPGRDQNAEEQNYLSVSHRRKKRRPHAAEIMTNEHFFDASRRESRDVWGEFYGTTWDSPAGPITGAELMSALRDHLAELQEEQCCYCRQPLLRGGHARPLEHVLSRVEHPKFTLHFWNLAVSCERCNRLKGEAKSEAFSEPLSSYPGHAVFRSQYHPRLHDYDSHITYAAITQNGLNIPLYAGRTAHGRNLCLQFLNKASMEMALVSSRSAFCGDVNAIEAFISRNDASAIDKIKAAQAAIWQAAVISASG